MDDKARFNTYLAPDLDDGLSELSAKTNISKNSLISMAVSKLLLEYGVIDLHTETQGGTQVLKSTEYCDLLKQGRIDLNPYTCTIERIHVKGTNEEEIRFAYYKKNKNGNDRLILRPLDINESELLMLYADALAKDVFTPDFRRKLKAIL